MTSSPIDIPVRSSLSGQVAASLRKGIEQETWEGYLPSERRLCELFHVSRPTIRAGLRMLAKAGLVEIKHGRKVRILTPSGSGPGSLSKRVGLITHEPLAHLATQSFQLISEMRAQLAEHGFAIENFVCVPGSAATQRRKIEAFVRQRRVLCCVLLSVSKELQTWFAEQSIPALVLGSCHPSVKLPSLDVDYRSVCRHAAGVLLSKGHRRVALVVPNSGIAGYLASEEGFLEGMARDSRAQGMVVRHSGTAQNMTARLDALFKSSEPPTALLVAKPQEVFLVIVYLLKRGISVPDTVSLMARDHDHTFELAYPAISHYTFRNETFAQTLARLLLRLVNEGFLAAEPTLIFPKYFAGGTVKALARP